MSIDKRKLGLFEKYHVSRTDGTSKPGGKHDDCDYFVLDLSHDKFAYKALAAYARACEDEYPALSGDLRERMQQMAEWMVLDATD